MNAPPINPQGAAPAAWPARFFLPALLLVALNLRPALTSVAPVLTQLQASLGLSVAAAGWLTTLPVLCLGVFAPLAPRLAQRLDERRAVCAVLGLLALGVAGRGAGGVVALFAGSLVAGAAIGMLGVLLPGIVKREYGARAGAVTGLYTMCLCLGASLAAGASVPVTQWAGGDWRPALALWALPAVLAALCWWPHLGQRGLAPMPRPAAGLWRDPLAWAVTLFMGFQSSLAYCVFGWLPTVLIERGVAPLTAGYMLSVSVLGQLATALGGPWLATHLGRDQRPALVLMLSLALVGLLGCLYAPFGTLWGCVMLVGLGQGGQFSVALLLMVLRAPDAVRAAQLSAMAQGVGYLIAACGPLAVGLLRDATGAWHAVALLWVGLTAGAVAAGWRAGRLRWVGAAAPS